MTTKSFLYRKPSFLCTSLPVMVQFCFLSFKLLRGCLNVITQLKCATIMHSILDDVFKAINSNDCLCVLFCNDLERVKLKYSIFLRDSLFVLKISSANILHQKCPRQMRVIMVMMVYNFHFRNSLQSVRCKHN